MARRSVKARRARARRRNNRPQAPQGPTLREVASRPNGSLDGACRDDLTNLYYSIQDMSETVDRLADQHKATLLTSETGRTIAQSCIAISQAAANLKLTLEGIDGLREPEYGDDGYGDDYDEDF